VAGERVVHHDVPVDDGVDGLRGSSFIDGYGDDIIWPVFELVSKRGERFPLNDPYGFDRRTSRDIVGASKQNGARCSYGRDAARTSGCHRGNASPISVARVGAPAATCLG
jgi:hypothetical protein